MSALLNKDPAELTSSYRRYKTPQKPNTPDCHPCRPPVEEVHNNNRRLTMKTVCLSKYENAIFI